jgi:alkylation response protein AidB-like acyl-CoA dehydrogenase
VDLLPDDDQALIAHEVRDLLDQHSPPGRLRDLPADGPVVDPKLWRLAADQGWFGLGLPEAAGGAGLGLPEQTLVFRELGRHLSAGPYLGTLLAAHLAYAADEHQLLERIIGGNETVGVCETLGLPAQSDVVDARTFDGADAELLLCIDERSARLLRRSDLKDSRQRPCIDLASRWVEGTLSGTPLAVTDDIAPLRARAGILVAAMLSGIAEATRDMSTSYAKLRYQFEVPIGSFQAVKHRCAEQAVRAEAATQAVTLAALAVDADRPDAELLAASARLVAGTYAVENAADNIQNHGGIGYTYEHDAHLFLKRAHVLSSTLHNPQGLYEEILAAPPARPA